MQEIQLTLEHAMREELDRKLEEGIDIQRVPAVLKAVVLRLKN